MDSTTPAVNGASAKTCSGLARTSRKTSYVQAGTLPFSVRYTTSASEMEETRILRRDFAASSIASPAACESLSSSKRNQITA